MPGRERGAVSSSRSALLSAIEGIHEDLRAINATLTTIASELTRERETRPASQRTTFNAQLLSLREAARRLGVDRNTTLAKLIRTGQLRTVETSGRIRISAAEVERFAKAGGTSATPPPAPVAPTPPRARKTRQRRRPRPAASPDIRDLDF
ncbi:helix-turn-helix domain-containing protein [Archangium violaceum]|uniref:helix-turn-helix domain-containing protein n=1 Tax=Archangium violaceum TaxID=83451 RepID=UPI00193AF17F|nr:helix-turn-helix domain-containing protein [Archangium violaceum]QRK07184.1 helix-turn-helix domain-containing protein [Archangium violaceum]